MIPELAALLRSCVAKSLEERVAISFSGGLDSTVIAKIASADAEVHLFCAGVGGSPDMEYAAKAASLLGLPLEKALMGEEDILGCYGMCHSVLPLGLLKLELLVPVWKAAESAASSGHSVLLFGTAAEELFVGYDRYFACLSEGKDVGKLLEEEFRALQHREISWISRICRKHAIEARFPLYDRKLWEFMQAVPLEERMSDRELKKPLLREAAKMLGVPELVLKRRKHAMQYASGIHKVVIRHAGELNIKYPPEQ